jgi:hypothetical protein
MGRVNIDFHVQPYVPSVLHIAISSQRSVRRNRHPDILPKIEQFPISLELVEAKSLGFTEFFDLRSHDQSVDCVQVGKYGVSNAISWCEEVTHRAAPIL